MFITSYIDPLLEDKVLAQSKLKPIANEKFNLA